MAKKQNKFKKTWKTQTELGSKYGISSIAVGKILKKYGLKNDDNTPTLKAIEEQYVHIVKNNLGRESYLWNVKANTFIGMENKPICNIEQTICYLQKEFKKIKNEMKDPLIELAYDKFGPDIVDSIWAKVEKKLTPSQINELKEKIKDTEIAGMIPQHV